MNRFNLFQPDHPAKHPCRHARIRRWTCFVPGFLALAGMTLASTAAGPVTTAGLLDEMTNMAGMAEFPDPPFTCKQFSSYDRAAKSPAENWFANGDCGQYLRVEDHAGRKEYVMMDADGPGAVVRIWSANPAGTLRIYLDGEDTPVLEAPMTDLLGGGTGGFPGPLAGEYSRGWNLYFPFPYANHCKITSDAGKFYYHVNYRTYPAGTEVASFTASQLTTLAGRIDKLAAELATPGAPPAQTAGEQHPFEFKLAPGETTRWRIAGPKAITEITARFEADDPTTALRAVLLEITFDGNRTVTAPLGDFFGSAPGLNEFATLPLAMTAAGGLRSNWFMPFRETAEIHLVNTGKEAVALTGNLRLTDHQWRPFSMYFHAKWRAQWDVPTRPMIDWNYLTATGKGVFAGVSFAIDNPVKEWWGEGDEKIYVDGEGFPSHFGTGTEDYYGYAWCWPGLFTHAYHSQSRCDGPGNYGRTSVNRFHIIDRIPFTRDFRFDMELWHWHQQCKVNMAVTAYWYAQPGATDGFTAPAAADLTVRPMPEWVVPHVAGALEGETLRITRVTGAADPQDWDNTSAGRHLWWHAGMKPGDSLNLAFPAPADGNYRVLGRFLSAPDYGIHQLAVNGQPAGQPIDFYRGEVTVGDEIDLGVFNLRVGDNEFSATITGANPKAVKAWMFGLDYLMLKPAP